jgi:hypothetical protein
MRLLSGRSVRASVTLSLAALLAGCATIMQGSTQQVSLGSTPTAARVTINGMERGTTPMVADLKRKDTHQIRIQADGYQPYELTLSRSVSGWVVGNILFGGIVGLAVDAITGGMYKLTPDQLQAALATADVSSVGNGDHLVLTVVLRADPEWERIATLTRE